jgi:hypothetical protein
MIQDSRQVFLELSFLKKVTDTQLAKTVTTFMTPTVKYHIQNRMKTSHSHIHPNYTLHPILFKSIQYYPPAYAEVFDVACHFKFSSYELAHRPLLLRWHITTGLFMATVFVADLV